MKLILRLLNGLVKADGIENENQHGTLITLNYCKLLENDSTPSARRSCKIVVVAKITTTVPLTATTGVITVTNFVGTGTSASFAVPPTITFISRSSGVCGSHGDR